MNADPTDLSKQFIARGVPTHLWIAKPDGRLEPSSCWGLPSLWSMGLFAVGLTTLAVAWVVRALMPEVGWAPISPPACSDCSTIPRFASA